MQNAEVMYISFLNNKRSVNVKDGEIKIIYYIFLRLNIYLVCLIFSQIKHYSILQNQKNDAVSWQSFQVKIYVVWLMVYERKRSICMDYL